MLGLLEHLRTAECVGGPEYFRLQLRRVHAVPRRRADAQLHLRPRAMQLKRGGGRADEVVCALHRNARDVPDALHALEQRLVLKEAVVHLDAQGRSLDAWVTGVYYYALWPSRMPECTE